MDILSKKNLGFIILRLAAWLRSLGSYVSIDFIAAFVKDQKIKKIIVDLLFIVFSCSSYAGFECRGAVTDVTVAPDGDVYMGKFKNWSWMKVCNVSRAENGATPEASKAIYSLLLTAQTTKKEVSFWFATGNCEAESQAPWQYLNSWYFGPKLVN